MSKCATDTATGACSGCQEPKSNPTGFGSICGGRPRCRRKIHILAQHTKHSVARAYAWNHLAVGEDIVWTMEKNADEHYAALRAAFAAITGDGP